jgi:hypothetical protein
MPRVLPVTSAHFPLRSIFTRIVGSKSLQQAGEDVSGTHFDEESARVRGGHRPDDLDPAHRAGQLRQQQRACFIRCGDGLGGDVRVDGPFRRREPRGRERRVQTVRRGLHQRRVERTAHAETDRALRAGGFGEFHRFLDA